MIKTSTLIPSILPAFYTVLRVEELNFALLDLKGILHAAVFIAR